MDSSHPLTFFFVIFLTFLPSLFQSQQPYSGLAIADCKNRHASTSVGYFCNGEFQSCQSYLTFRSQPPYQSVPTISALLGTDPSQLSEANAVSEDATFPTSWKVIVHIYCFCLGAYYRSNSYYVVQPSDSVSTLSIANGIFQGLSTCQALEAENSNSLSSGHLTTVPLRCACPTSIQRLNGVRYLLSYSVDMEESVLNISQKLGVTEKSIIDANELSKPNASVYPFTTLVIPLKDQPHSFHSAPSPPPPPPPPPVPSPLIGNTAEQTWLPLGIGFAGCVVVLIPSITIVYVLLKGNRGMDNSGAQWRMHTGPETNVAKMCNDKDPTRGILSHISDTGLKVYTFQELQLATANFSSKCKIEGSVYRAVISGEAAAIKMMKRDVLNEVEILKRINHFNLIRLSGICLNKGRWFLVYDYVQNGPLSNWIFNRDGLMVLSWTQRVQIALDVADGLNYLHSYTHPVYVHKDINSSNILLDDKYRAKIANFGLARPAERREGDFESTIHIVGTKGYMTPEYLVHGLVSPKLDVYAFGVVMMEMITGKDVANAQRGGDDKFSMDVLIAALCEEVTVQKLGGIIDPLLEENYPLDLALIMARLIEGCLRQDAAGRPSMEEVSHSLSKLLVASQNWEFWNGLSESQSFSIEMKTPDSD